MLNRRDLNVSDTLGCVGRKNSKPIIEGLVVSQSLKKPKDLSSRERDERGCGERGGMHEHVKATILSQTL